MNPDRNSRIDSTFNAVISRRKFLKAAALVASTVGVIAAPQLLGCGPASPELTNAAGKTGIGQLAGIPANNEGKSCIVRTTQRFDGNGEVASTATEGPQWEPGPDTNSRTFVPSDATEAGPNVTITIQEVLDGAYCNK